MTSADRLTLMARAALLALVALVALVLPILMTVAAAQDGAYSYDHNGSGMTVTVDGTQVSVVYREPRDGLRALGIRPGRLLFAGRATNGYLQGMGRIFSRRCGELDYFVYGDFVPGEDFRLVGAAPVLERGGCRLIDNRSDVANANLRFLAVGPAAPERACVVGVDSTLNVRVGPGTRFGRIGEIPAATCGIAVFDRCRESWCAVRFDGLFGWVSTRHLSR